MSKCKAVMDSQKVTSLSIKKKIRKEKTDEASATKKAADKK